MSSAYPDLIPATRATTASINHEHSFEQPDLIPACIAEGIEHPSAGPDLIPGAEEVRDLLASNISSSPT